MVRPKGASKERRPRHQAARSRGWRARRRGARRDATEGSGGLRGGAPEATLLRRAGGGSFAVLPYVDRGPGPGAPVRCVISRILARKK